MEDTQTGNNVQNLDSCIDKPRLAMQIENALVKKKLGVFMGNWDQQLCDLLEFGFPLDFDKYCQLHSIEENNTMDHISQFLHEEMQYQATFGPFDSKPIDMHNLHC